MRISMTAILLGAASIAINCPQANAGSYAALGEDKVRMVTHIKAMPLDEGGYLEEIYNTGSIRRTYFQTGCLEPQKEMYFFGIKEVRIDEDDGSETLGFVNPLFIYNKRNVLMGEIMHHDGARSNLILETQLDSLLERSSIKGLLSEEESADFDEDVQPGKRKKRLKVLENNNENTHDQDWKSSSSSSSSTPDAFEKTNSPNIQSKLRAWKKVPEVYGLRNLISARRMHYENYRANELQGREFEFFHVYVGEWSREGLQRYINTSYYEQFQKNSKPEPVSLSKASPPKRVQSFITRLKGSH